MDDDAFALLGLPRQFEIDRAALQAAYLKRSAALHPDRMTDPIRRAEAASLAAQINDARAVLADDERRANLLLRLLGGPAREQDKSLPDGFLVEIMEMRQDMEEALASGESAERARIQTGAAKQREAYRSRVAELFEQAQAAPDPALLREIRLNLNAWRYIERLIEQLHVPYHAGPEGTADER